MVGVIMFQHKVGLGRGMVGDGCCRLVPDDAVTSTSGIMLMESGCFAGGVGGVWVRWGCVENFIVLPLISSCFIEFHRIALWPW